MRDITQAEFETEVIQASHDRGVVVDFWAPWCGPCHQLSPLLERVAQRHAAEVDVVKLNVDEAPEVARRFQVQGIPAVKAFKGGKVAAEFVGVQPETVIQKLFDAVAPSPADRLVEQAADAPDDQAEPLLRQALELERDHAAAIVFLARILLAREDREEAQKLLARIPADDSAKRLLAQLRLGSTAQDDLDVLGDAAAAGGVQSSLRLGQALARTGDYSGALPHLLTAVREPATRVDARDAVLAVFEVLGAEDELVRTWRPKLAAALF